MKIIKNNIDDETIEYCLIDGPVHTMIAYLTHDEHGWDGIRTVEEVIEVLAKATNIEIEEVFP
jgi:hypothetical protein